MKNNLNQYIQSISIDQSINICLLFNFYFHKIFVLLFNIFIYNLLIGQVECSTNICIYILLETLYYQKSLLRESLMVPKSRQKSKLSFAHQRDLLMLRTLQHSTPNRAFAIMKEYFIQTSSEHALINTLKKCPRATLVSPIHTHTHTYNA